MSELLIREYTPERKQEDVDPLLKAFLEIWNEPDNLKFLSFTNKPFEEITVRDWFTSHLSRGVRYYAAIGTDKEISGISVIRCNLVEGYEIIGVGVRSKSKRQGVGSKLLEHTINVAAGQGFRVVDADVFTDNFAMLRILLSFSFVPVSMDFKQRWDGVDTLRMRRFQQTAT